MELGKMGHRTEGARCCCLARSRDGMEVHGKRDVLGEAPIEDEEVSAHEVAQYHTIVDSYYRPQTADQRA